MVRPGDDRDDAGMNHSPSFIASICFIAAVLAIGPFGQTEGSEADAPDLTCSEATAAVPQTSTAPCRP